MRTGFDAHMVGERETGNETYALGLLEGFQAIGVPIDTYAFRPLPFGLHRQHHISPHSAAIRIPFSIPLAGMRDRLDLFHATYVLPPVMPCRTVVTVHDITFALFPQWFAAPVRTMLSTLVPRAMRSADRIITISEQTKRDIVDQYAIPPDKISVTYLAPRPAFATPQACSEQRQPFFLAVGNVQPRKNLGVLLHALSQVGDDYPEARLVIAGKPGPDAEPLYRLVHSLKLDNAVHFTGYVSDAELRKLYSHCLAHVHPALYEGFGLTPLEAMVQGAPVIASNRSSLPEVVGDAALLASPSEPDAWADAMRSLLSHTDLRDDLTRRGRARAAGFTWERCARETLAVYRTALRENAPNG